MTTRIKLRRDTEANWMAADPVLALGEAGYDTTNNALRVGDGVTTWGNLTPIAGGSGGNITSPDGDNIMWLNNSGELVAGPDGTYDVEIGNTDNAQNAKITISQDNPYIRSEVQSTTSNNYRNEMMWHNPWYSRYNKLITNAYGVHVQNAQWSGPGTNYFNRWSFTKDGVFNMPPAAVIRSNDFQSSYWYDPLQDENINNDSSVNPGTDSSLTFDANTVSIARGSLNMNGTSALPVYNDYNGYWIAMAGSFGQNSVSTVQEGSCMDEAGNVYTLQSAQPGGPNITAVTKWSSTGDRLWQRVLYEDDSTGGQTNEVFPVGISFHNGTLTIALNDYSSSRDQPLFMYVNSDTGAMSDPGDTFVSPTKDLEINDFAGLPSNGGFAAVGRAASGVTYLTPSFIQVATQTVQSGQRLVVSRDNTFAPASFGWNPFPTPDTQNQWFMFGTGITGNVAINAVNTVSNLTATRTSGDGTGTNARFTATWNTGSYVVTATTAGTNYNDNDVLVISGADLGGISPTNDITFSPVTDAGAIVNITGTSGTANVAVTVLGLSGNPVDFSAIPTPTILVNTSTDALLVTGYVYYPGLSYSTFGNVGWDTFNAVAFDTISSGGFNGNVYVGGRYHPTGNSGPRRSVLAKIVNDGDLFIKWQVEVDDYTGRNEVRGIAVDGEGNVYTVAENNNINTTVTKVNSEGVMQWQRIINNTTFSPTYDHTTYGIGVNSKGDVIVTGLAVRGDDFDGDNEDITIVAFDTYGQTIWARTLGTPQDEFSRWDRTYDNITVKDDTMIITGRSYAGGYRNTHPSDSVGFVAKLPADGTGVGHYGEWRYLETTVEIQTVSNTAANTATMTFVGNDIGTTSNTYAYANVAVRNNGAPEFALPSITYKVGGPGAITGLNQLRFTNGASITNVSEEGLLLWQPSPTVAQLNSGIGHNAEYIAMGYGGDSGESANIQISAGTYNWASDDGPLDIINYPDNGAGQSQQQINLDIVSEGFNRDNISNWHFDEDGTLYLPAQSGYRINSANIVDGNTVGGGLLTEWYFSKADYPKLGTLVQPGDRAWALSEENWTRVVEVGSYDANSWYVHVDYDWAQTQSDPAAIGFTNVYQQGIVYPDGSKQTGAGVKYIPGNLYDQAWGKGATSTYGNSESLLWTASRPNVNAFRATIRCQMDDSATGMKMYDVVGSTYSAGGGDTDFVATELISITGNGSTAPFTFRIDKGGDGYMRLYITGPTDYANSAYITSDFTEFGYTID